MGAAPPHPRENDRLKALRSYEVLDTDPEPSFDDVTRLAARVCDTPIALVSLLDEDRQWFKARHNLDAPETPRRQAICAHAILEKEMLVVPDTMADPRFADNDLCCGPPHLRFYAGARLETSDGLPLGTLCVLDTEPRDLDSVQRDSLRILADQVMRQLEDRRTLKRQAVMLREDAHRAKNALSVTQALMRMSRQHAASLDEFMNAFEPRLAALADAQTLTSDSGLERVSLKELIDRQLRSFAGDRAERLVISGEDAFLTASAAEGMGLALHELGTNAAKYGAWSEPRGRVEISWTDGPGDGLAFCWREVDGPAPEEAEALSKGFGSQLLERIAPAMLGGKATLAIEGTGAVWQALVAKELLAEA